MSYRDDLEAAHQRIAALERELGDLRRGNAPLPPSDPKVASMPMGEVFARLESSAILKAPLIRQRPHPRKRAYPLSFSAYGAAGERRYVPPRRAWHLLKPEEMFAFDTAPQPGHGTTIESVFFGASNQLEIDSGLPTWMFYEWVPESDRESMRAAAKLNGTPFETAETRSAAARLRIAEAAGRLDWRPCPPGLDITFVVKFHEACRWEAVLWCAQLL